MAKNEISSGQDAGGGMLMSTTFAPVSIVSV